MNFLSGEVLISRAYFLSYIRAFFQSNGFLEMDTPVFMDVPGLEPHLDPYSVYNPEGQREGFLATSPEYALKQCLALGVPKVYELSHSFRSGEKGTLHTREFLMLEFYETNITELELMDRCISLFAFLNDHFRNFGFTQEQCVKITVAELFHRELGTGFSRENLIECIETKLPGLIEDIHSALYEDLFYLLFLNYIEPTFVDGPIFVYDYPPEMAALARVENGVARRFEIYWKSVEVGNAFYELNDVGVQMERFQKEQLVRQKLNKEVFAVNPDFQKALEIGIPRCAGIAIGVDRLFMIAMQEKDLRFLSPYFVRQPAK
jgi:elongation factor P--(R)-beta-lysine ligase